MGFGPMDGFFLSIFLALCILAAVVARCLCYRLSCAKHILNPATASAGSPDAILPRRHPAPIITPARRTQPGGSLAIAIPDTPVVPNHGAVFTIYTFPQPDDSPVLPRSDTTVPDPPKYSSLPVDAPPRYEDLFPLADFTLACKGTDASSDAVAPDDPSSPSTAPPAPQRDEASEPPPAVPTATPPEPEPAPPAPSSQDSVGVLRPVRGPVIQTDL